MEKIILVLLALGLFGCAHNHDKLPKESNVTITKNFSGHRWGNIYFSGQPNASVLKNLKADGFATIINLREKTEGPYVESWEQETIKKLGMTYYNVPFSMKDEMNDGYVELVTSKVMKHRKEGKILIHCSSGNRVAVWLGAHFKKDHKFSEDKSLELAKELGLTKPKAEKKLLTYLKD